jgi:hypothetical protein
VSQPLGPHVAAWLDRSSWLRHRDDDALLDTAFRPATTLRRDVVTAPDVGGWRELAQALVLDEGFRWSLPCDDAVASVVAACDGRTPLRVPVAVLAAVLDAPADDVAAAVCASVRGLVDRGLLLPPS